MTDAKRLRTGLGVDVHAFAKDRKLIVGGVEIPYEYGLEGHSDADVLLHAISDALLGAARLGDIGQHFPDTDQRFKGADSLELLKQVGGLLDEAGYAILDIDSVIIAQAPKMSPYRDDMRSNIALALGLDREDVGVKSTTTEHLGFAGRKEGIACIATCLICAS